MDRSGRRVRARRIGSGPRAGCAPARPPRGRRGAGRPPAGSTSARAASPAARRLEQRLAAARTSSSRISRRVRSASARNNATSDSTPAPYASPACISTAPGPMIERRYGMGAGAVTEAAAPAGHDATGAPVHGQEVPGRADLLRRRPAPGQRASRCQPSQAQPSARTSRPAERAADGGDHLAERDETQPPCPPGRWRATADTASAAYAAVIIQRAVIDGPVPIRPTASSTTARTGVVPLRSADRAARSRVGNSGWPRCTPATSRTRPVRGRPRMATAPQAAAVRRRGPVSGAPARG